MKLITNERDLTSAAPVFPVRWCLDQSEIKQLADAQNIHVLFVIAYEGGREDRMLVPIGQMMAYLNFCRPGKHTVLATVLWGSGFAPMQKICMERSNRHAYIQELLGWDRTNLRRYEFSDHEIGMLPNSATAALEVTIPAEHFPKEPPAWLRRPVNFQFPYPPVDECDFRRRCLVALPRLAYFGVWAVITTFIRAIIAVAYALHGARDIDFRAVLHPWRSDIDDVAHNVRAGDSVFLSEKFQGRVRSRWLLVLYPYIWLVLFAVVTAVKAHYHLTYWAAVVLIAGAILKAALVAWKSLVKLFLKTGVRALALAALFAVLYGIVRFVLSLAIQRQKARCVEEYELVKQTGLTLEDRRRLEREKEHEAFLASLTCQTMPLEVNIDALPPERRTVKLRFLRLKAGVCRPYAQ
jgi:hypothetical protein